MPEITAILPAYNEEVAIGCVVLRTRKFADRVIVIDDGSHDRTAEVAALARAEETAKIHHQDTKATKNAQRRNYKIPESNQSSKQFFVSPLYSRCLCGEHCKPQQSQTLMEVGI